MKTVSKAPRQSSHKTGSHGDTNGRNGAATVSDLTPNPEGPLPPLPNPIPFPPEPTPFAMQPMPIPGPIPGPIPFLPHHFRTVREGCYLLNYMPSGAKFVIYDGTMRVERNGRNTTASGDLYQRQVITLPPKPGFPPIIFPPIPGPPPNPAAGIPVFARSRYRYYLRVTQILEWITFGNSFTLGIEMHRFNAGAWTNEGSFAAVMSWNAAPSGYPSSGDYLTGDVKNASGTVVGKLTMGWVSKYLRRAVIEIDRVPVSEAPLNNGAGIDWKTVFDEVDWDVTIVNSNNNVVETSGESWSDGEMHAGMLARRDSSNLDVEWRYHILGVRRIDTTPRGIMYDAFGTDSNNVPREGIGISSHWMIPNTAEWGLVRNMRFGAAAKPYFRTALHEIGHAMGLYHNTIDMGIMNTTDVIAANAVPPVQFPDNVKWSYAPDDQKRLRHMPDVYVRPGGTPFGTSYSTTPISPDDMIGEVEGLQLHVSPLLESVPMGAPVRINLELVNASNEPLPAPSSLSMKDGFVKGTVIDPSGTMRTFSPILLCIEEHPMQILEAGKRVRNSLTLLRGGQGPLFPAPGLYRICVEVHWDANGAEYSVTGQTAMMVTSVVDEAHAEAALKVLSTPDVLLTLVFGGDHLSDGISAVQTAVNNPVLGPHFAFIEAKRVGERFGKRKPDFKMAAELINESTVMSPAEVKRAAKLLKKEGADDGAAKSIMKTLKHKATSMDVGDDIKQMVDSIS